MGFNPGFEHPTCLATLKSSDRTKQSVCGWQYIYIYIYIYIYDWGAIHSSLNIYVERIDRFYFKFIFHYFYLMCFLECKVYDRDVIIHIVLYLMTVCFMSLQFPNKWVLPTYFECV